MEKQKFPISKMPSLITENNQRKIAVFDLDGTLIDAHLWLGIVKHHLKTKENLLFVFLYLATHLALVPFWKAGLISTEKYFQSWGRDLAITFKGIKVERAREIFNSISDNHLLPSLKKKVLERLKRHQQDGFTIILISGCFQNLVEIVASHLKVDFAIGTELERKSDQFSGKIVPPLCFGQAKVEKLKKFLMEKNLKINFKKSFAYSDSFFDLPLLELVGNPVVVEPDKKLLEIAKNRGWQII